jgi:acetoin utilization deacetylase AcuC-like enzyme
MRAVRNDFELFSAVEHLEARYATPDEIALAHSPAHIQTVERVAREGGGALDSDTVLSEGSWDAARAAVGAVLDAVDRAVSGVNPRSFCAVRPPGHHALANRAMGFCLFGNVAIGALYARHRHGLERVLIVDWDVHHGNGTQALVQSDPGIHFVSMHQWPWYPGTGAASDRGQHENVWNVPMPPGRPRAEYVGALEEAIDAAARDFEPQLIMISAGFDSLAGDPLGGFTLEPEDFVHLTQSLTARADACCNGRLISALEGGYAPDAVAGVVVSHMRALAGLA